MIPCVFTGIAAVVFGLDVILKQAIEETFTPGEERIVAGGKVRIRKVYNEGAALGFMKNRADVLKKISALLGIAALLYDALLLRKPRRFLEKTGMMLFTGGAFSNIFDRILRGRVIDYIGFQTRWTKVTEITYNLGDFAIFIGAALETFSHVFGKRQSKFTVKKTPLPDRE